MPSDAQAGPNQAEIQVEFDAHVQSLRTGVLLTLCPEGPFGSHVPFLMGQTWTEVYLHLSGLAAHTKNLAGDRRISLFLAEPDRPDKNPLALKRLNLQGTAAQLAPEDPRTAEIRARYQQRFPQSAVTFDLPDFRLWVLEMARAHFVAGFGRAFVALRDAPQAWVRQGP